MIFQFLRHIQSFVLIIVLFSHLGLLNSSISTFVLCFGANYQHVAVEHFAHKHTVDTLKAAPNNVNYDASSASEDSLCTDIAIAGDDGITDLSKLSVDLGLAFAVCFFLFLFAYSRQVAPLSLVFDLLFTDSRLLAHRSIVLLI